MKNRRNYYRVLHVQPDAPKEIIRSSYQTMMQRMRMHPDLGGDDNSAAVINEAYEALSDPGNRAAYDKTRQAPGQSNRIRRTTEVSVPHRAAVLQRCAFCGLGHEFDNQVPANAFCDGCHSPLLPIEQSQLVDGDRRTITRLPNDHPIIICTHWPQSEPYSGRTENMSLNGLKFRSNTRLSLGQIIKIDSQILRAVARVIYIEQHGMRQGVGVQFVSLYFEQSRGSFIANRV